MALVGGKPVPARRFDGVPERAAAVEMHRAEVVLRAGVAGLRRTLVPAERGLEVAQRRRRGLEDGAEHVLRLDGAVGGKRPQGIDRLRVVAAVERAHRGHQVVEGLLLLALLRKDRGRKRGSRQDKERK